MKNIFILIILFTCSTYAQDDVVKEEKKEIKRITIPLTPEEIIQENELWYKGNPDPNWELGQNAVHGWRGNPSYAVIDTQEFYPENDPTEYDFQIDITAVAISTAWSLENLKQHQAKTVQTLRSCGIKVNPVNVIFFDQGWYHEVLGLLNTSGDADEGMIMDTPEKYRKNGPVIYYVAGDDGRSFGYSFNDINAKNHGNSDWRATAFIPAYADDISTLLTYDHMTEKGAQMTQFAASAHELTHILLRYQPDSHNSHYPDNIEHNILTNYYEHRELKILSSDCLAIINANSGEDALIKPLTR